MMIHSIFFFFFFFFFPPPPKKNPLGFDETTLIDFFVAAPGKDGTERGVELAPVPVHFDAETVQTFYVGPASCGVPGTAAGLELALRRFGSASLSVLAAPGVRLAREGAPVNNSRPTSSKILWPIHERLPGTRELYAPQGRPLGRGDVLLRRAGRDAGAVRRRGGRAVLPRRGGGGAERLRRRARRHPGADRPGRLRGDRAAADPGALPRHRGADQPAALLGRDPDRPHARPAQAPRGEQRPRAAGRGDGRRQRRPRRGVRRSPLRRGAGGGAAGPGAARPGRCSARPLTSRPSTGTGSAPASPARTARAPACSSPAPG